MQLCLAKNTSIKGKDTDKIIISMGRTLIDPASCNPHFKLYRNIKSRSFKGENCKRRVVRTSKLHLLQRSLGRDKACFALPKPMAKEGLALPKPMAKEGLVSELKSNAEPSRLDH